MGYAAGKEEAQEVIGKIDMKDNILLTGLNEMIASHKSACKNLERPELIQEIISNKEALVTRNGALYTWTPPHSTGRSPKDTYVVRRPESQEFFDWSSQFNNAMSPETFDSLWHDALKIMATKNKVYVADKVIGADPQYALPTRVVISHAIYVLFADNMFLPVPGEIEQSCFADRGFTLLSLPYDKVPKGKYDSVLRSINGKASDIVIALDMDRRLGLIMGSCYCGVVKKSLFTVVNYLLPAEGILPLHCSANEGPDGQSALFLGLSGTGKTTLSAAPDRELIGDDEHGWSDSGIANFENGCYAKLIDLDPDKEPEIYQAAFHEAPPLEHGAIIENAMIYPNGDIDLSDGRLTENSRVSYPLSFLKRVKEGGQGNHPKTIIFLTADAHGVLPPVARLTSDQAMLWFLMGYTSKLAGTETGVTEPVSTFSRFFGAPFMPRNPEDYIKGFGEKIAKHQAAVFLINTGWTGGPYGVGKRFDINDTRNMVKAALKGEFDKVEFREDSRFHLMVPTSCPGVSDSVLNPKNTWTDKDGYEDAATKLANQFSESFDKSYGHKNIPEAVKAQCPGK